VSVSTGIETISKAYGVPFGTGGANGLFDDGNLAAGNA
jgi:hypothetical protein